jgi:hypothetical protein
MFIDVLEVLIRVFERFRPSVVRERLLDFRPRLLLVWTVDAA